MNTLAAHWTLDPDVIFLNHGSFGACPRVVLEEQSRLRAVMEREPVRFFVRSLQAYWDAARDRLAAFVGSRVQDLVFVPNATTGVNAVLRSLRFRSGDELLTTSHAYNACKNALEFVAQQQGAKVTVAEVPFPLHGDDDVVEAVVAAVTPRTRLALIDHVTSPTALIFPLQRLVKELQARNVEVLVDGAHAPGMVPLELHALGAEYYTANCHKWLCTPKGVAFLHVREDKQRDIRPTVISHGANAPPGERSRFQVEFDWTGTDDPTPVLALPASLDFLETLLPNSVAELQACNNELVRKARRLLCDTLDVPAPCPDEMLGSMAALPLPDGDGEPPKSPLFVDPLGDRLLFQHHIEVPVVPWPGPPKRLIRVSAQAYNELGDYERLCEALRSELR